MDRRDPAKWWRETRLFGGAFALAAIGATLFCVTIAVTGAASWRLLALFVLLPAVLVIGVFQHAARQERIDEASQVRREP
jgi:cytochrome c oxidase subunit IV